MPRILDDSLRCVVYLYRSFHEAEEGINIGGSAFLMSVPGERLPPPAGFVYVITNKHVIEQGALFIRANTLDGKCDTFETTRDQWLVAHDDDLAICVVPGFHSPRMLVKTIPRYMILTPEVVDAENVGPGDEVILIGRFINQEGKERNIPSVRFGHISQMPIEPLEYEGTLQDSFLCEIKSIGGFSGSPVFLVPVTEMGRPTNSILAKEARLLGVDWAHLRNFERAIDNSGREIPHVRFPTNTGMMAVVPAWKLNLLLDHPKAKRFREMEEDNEIRRRQSPTIATDVSSVVTLPASDEDPNSLPP
jgi:hypothetical protein